MTWNKLASRNALLQPSVYSSSLLSSSLSSQFIFLYLRRALPIKFFKIQTSPKYLQEGMRFLDMLAVSSLSFLLQCTQPFVKFLFVRGLQN